MDNGANAGRVTERTDREWLSWALQFAQADLESWQEHDWRNALAEAMAVLGPRKNLKLSLEQIETALRSAQKALRRFIRDLEVGGLRGSGPPSAAAGLLYPVCGLLRPERGQPRLHDARHRPSGSANGEGGARRRAGAAPALQPRRDRAAVRGGLGAVPHPQGVRRRYAGTWPADRFRAHRISYEPAEKTKSQLYGEALALLNSGNVEQLDDKRLLSQLLSLERRTSWGGRDSIDHPPNAHDDLANCAVGALLLA